MSLNPVSRRHRRNARPYRAADQERTVTLQYVSHPKRTVEREAWLVRQNPEERRTHLYGRLFVSPARELYFVEFQIEGGSEMICWLVNKHQRRLRVTEDAHRRALRNPQLGGHQFYQRCNGAWRVEDLCLDTRSSRPPAFSAIQALRRPHRRTPGIVS